FTQTAFGRLSAVTRGPGLPGRAASVLSAMARRLPTVAGGLVRAVAHVPHMALTAQDMDDRLVAAREVFRQVDTFVAPSASIASEFEQLGVERSKIRVSDYGFVPLRPLPRNGGARAVRLASLRPRA